MRAYLASERELHRHSREAPVPPLPTLDGNAGGMWLLVIFD
jgi:hypothetical protein